MEEQECAGCRTPVTAWPWVSVPQDDGSRLVYHQGCEPWRHPDVPADDPVRPIPNRWRPMLAGIVERLVSKDYAGLTADGLVSYSNDPADDSIGRWIEDYPATLVPLPEEAWEHGECGRFTDDPDAWWVVLDLWTAEEGRSDLSLEATVRESDDRVTVSVDYVHVM